MNIEFTNYTKGERFYEIDAHIKIEETLYGETLSNELDVFIAMCKDYCDEFKFISFTPDNLPFFVTNSKYRYTGYEKLAGTDKISIGENTQKLILDYCTKMDNEYKESLKPIYRLD